MDPQMNTNEHKWVSVMFRAVARQWFARAHGMRIWLKFLRTLSCVFRFSGGQAPLLRIGLAANLWGRGFRQPT